MNLNSLNSLFRKDVAVKGRDYFRRSMVSNVIQTDFSVTAKVDGSNNNKYDVEIKFNRNMIAVSMTCTCPYIGFCKHVYAALMFFETFGPHKKIEKPVINPLVEYADFEEKTRNIDLYNFNENSRLNDFIEDIKLIEKKHVNAKNKYKGVVVIEVSISNYNMDSKITIVPKLQCIKKNGTPGKLVNYSIMKNEELPSDDLLDLYNELTKSNSNIVKAERYIDYIIAKKLKILISNKTEITIPEYIEAQNVGLDFKLSGYGEEILFSTDFIFNLGDNTKVSIYDKSIILNGKTYIAFIKENPAGIIYVDKSKIPIMAINIINKIIKEKILFSIKDIGDLSIFLSDNKIDKYIKIYGYPNKIEEKELIPKTVIEIEEYYGDIKLRFLFEYDKTNRYLNNQEYKYLLYSSINLDKNDIILYKVNKDFEDSVYNYVTKKLEKTITTHYYRTYESDNSKTLNVKMKPLDFITTYGTNFIDEGFELKFRESKEKIKKGRGILKLSVKNDLDWFDIHAKIEMDGNEYDINIYDLNKGLLKVNNEFVFLTKEDIEKLKSYTKTGMNNEGELKISKFNFSAIDVMYEEIEKTGENLDRFKQIIERIKNFDKIAEQNIPVNFKGVLRDYQKAGYCWLYFLYEYGLNGCLADDMGLGKTIQTLCFLQRLKDDLKKIKILLIVPVTTIPNWESEIIKFTPQLKSHRHIGTGRVKESEIFDKSDILITSYHTFRNDVVFFKQIEFDYVILDEAQNIKNANSLAYKSVKLVNTKHKLTLTGTPVENSTLELWAQMDFLNPGLLGSVNQFKKDYANDIEKYHDKNAAEDLRKLIYPFILRRKKEDVAKDLPDKEEIIYYCEMGEKQKDFYNSIKKECYDNLAKTIEENGVKKSAMAIFSALLRMRQAVLFPQVINSKFSDIPSCKNEALTEITDEILSENHKTLIFSQFVECLKIIEKNMKEKSYKYSYIDGSTKKREEEIKKFQNDKDVQLFLLSLKAGGVGINLTAAEYVILFDPWWNPAVESQAIDRAHRIGQKNKVIVYKLIVKDSVEEKILILQEKKKILVKELITEDSSLFKTLNKSDILELFE